MKRIEHRMTWRELDAQKDDRALVPILREKGMPLNDDLTAEYGSLHWVDSNASGTGPFRMFIWEGDFELYTQLQRKLQPVEEPLPEPSVGKRAITFED